MEKSSQRVQLGDRVACSLRLGSSLGSRLDLQSSRLGIEMGSTEAEEWPRGHGALPGRHLLCRRRLQLLASHLP